MIQPVPAIKTVTCFLKAFLTLLTFLCASQMYNLHHRRRTLLVWWHKRVKWAECLQIKPDLDMRFQVNTSWIANQCFALQHADCLPKLPHSNHYSSTATATRSGCTHLIWRVDESKELGHALPPCFQRDHLFFSVPFASCLHRFSPRQDFSS